MKEYIVGMFIVFMTGLFILPVSAQDPEQLNNYDRYVFRESETLFQQNQSGRARFLPGVSSFGSGGIGLFSLPSLSPFSWQFGAGLFSISGVADRQYRSTLVNERALALPLYTGVRYDVYRGSGGSVNYAIFGSLIGGPVIGMSVPDRSGFSATLEATKFRWGAGGQAALGFEMFFSERWAGYVQAGVDAVGFTRELGSEKGYFGPAFGLGFGRLLGR